MIDVNKKIQSLVTEILFEIKKELIKVKNNKIKIDTKKNRLCVGAYKHCPDSPVLTELFYDQKNNNVYIVCQFWISYKIPLVGILNEEVETTNIGKIDYIDYINIYKALLNNI